MPRNETHPEEFTVEVNGLVFEALGAGPPEGELVLLLHGFPQFADSWTGLMESLAESGYHAVAFNQRGYSPRARPAVTHQYRMEALVADVLGVADALGAPRFHLAGHDWGGAVGWVLAARHADRLCSLSVLSTPHLDAFAEALARDPDQKRRSLYMALFRAPEHLAERTFLAFDAKVLRGVYQGKVATEQVRANIQRFREDGALSSALNWYRANTFAGGTGKISVPTLFLWGDQDVALGKTAAFATGGNVEAAYRFVHLAGASHWLLEEVPLQVRSAVLDHLGAHPCNTAPESNYVE